MDWRLFHWFNTLQVHTAWAHAPFRLYATDGIALVALAIGAGWWIASRRHDPGRVAAAGWAALAALLGLAVNQAVGHLVQRPRPYAAHPGVSVLIGRTGDFSFPSDHLVVCAAVAAALFFVDRRLGVVTAILAAGMALARVYVGAHYPGDVLGGALIGVAIAVAGWPLAARVLVPVTERLARSRIRPLALAAGGPLVPAGRPVSAGAGSRSRGR